MKMVLTDFIRGWNATHKKVVFTRIDSAIGCVNSIEIRFSANAFKKFLTREGWDKLSSAVEERSHGTMMVSTAFRHFVRGIVEIKVASSNYNFKEEYAVSVLNWIGTELFQLDN